MTVGIYTLSGSQSTYRQRLALDIKGHQLNSVALYRLQQAQAKKLICTNKIKNNREDDKVTDRIFPFLLIQ